jgi:hypothetical protein
MLHNSFGILKIAESSRGEKKRIKGQMTLCILENRTITNNMKSGYT